jgi:hypothetical protein
MKLIGGMAAAVALATAQGAWGATLLMGPTGTYATLAQAVSAAQPGDTINIQAATYNDQVAVINKPLTLVGINGTPVFLGTTALSNSKGFIVADASLTVNNLQFQNAFTPQGNNGAGIRYEAGDLTVLNSRFINNQDGILATPLTSGTGTLTVQNSTFTGNGVASGSGSGFAHAIYANNLAAVTVTGSTFEGTQVGHDIKSRAISTTITGNYLDDGVTGTTSYAIDLPNGGDVVITGNTIVQGMNSQNPIMIAYGAEGLTHALNRGLFTQNTLTNSRSGGVGVQNFVTDPSLTDLVFNSAYSGLATPTAGPFRLIGLNDSPPANVPEPASWAVFTFALAGLALIAAGRRGRAVQVA